MSMQVIDTSASSGMAALTTADGLYPRFSDAEFARRHALVRGTMQEADVPVLLVYGLGRGLHNELQFLSNFAVSREAMLVFPAEGEPTLLVQHYNHVPNARELSRVRDVRWAGPDTAATTAQELRHRGFAQSRIGLAGPLPLQRYEALRRELPEATLLDVTGSLAQLRMVKSDEEITFLRKGAEWSDRAIEALAREARPGLTEHQLAAIVEGAYLGEGGSNWIHFMATTPMRNPTVCVPKQHHGNRVVQKGDVLITEISAQYCGYPGQILRPFAIGEPPTPDYQRLYDVALEAYERIRAVLRPGASTDEVLDQAEYIHQQGYTIYDDLVHGFGGGYLAPVLRTRRTSARPAPPLTFRENMTIVVQPNVITPDERMGIQVGDLLRVTAAGVESLQRYPMRFIQCGT